MTERTGFGSKLGVILATAGSAVDWVMYGVSHTWLVKMVVLYSS